MNAVLNARRARAAAAWNLRDEVVLIGAGEPIGVPGGYDQTYTFIAHAEYFWLADRDTPGALVAFDAQTGWTDFVPQVTENQRLWEGTEQEPGEPLAELPGWLAARRGRPVISLGVPLTGMSSEPMRTHELRELLTHARRPKDASEIARLKRAAAASVAGYAKLREMVRPGVTERALQIEMEAEFFRAGGDRCSYDSIVASGPRSAILHSLATSRVLGAGELLLVDAGAMVNRYASDVTRTYAVSGTLEGLQKEMYAVILQAEKNAIAACTVGREWRAVHYEAAREMVAGLVTLDIMRGDPVELVEREAHTLFFPHGLGHMVGLGVRDASGRLPGSRDPMPNALRTLRTDLPLEAGYCITVEPGLYFVPALLDNPVRRARYKDAVNWARVDTLKDFGGIRIEDNVLVTENGPDNLTAAIPK